MKLAWTLMIIGIILIPEGLFRMTVGIIAGNYLYAAGGAVTGLLIGIILLVKGNARRKWHTVKKVKGVDHGNS